MADSDSRFNISKKQGCFGGGCVTLAGLFVLFLFSIPFWGKIADWIWLRSVGAEQIFTTRYGTELYLGLGTAAIVVASCLATLLIARVVATRGTSIYEPDPEVTQKALVKKSSYSYDSYDSSSRTSSTSDEEVLAGEIASSKWATWGILGTLIGVLAIVEGLATSGNWQTFLLWQHAVPFTASGAPMVDPIFHMDLGYFFFTLPAQELALRWAGAILEANIIVAGLWYVGVWFTRGQKHPRGAVVHMAVLVAARIALGAGGFELGKFDLSFAQNGWATGVGAADEASRFGAFDQMAILTLIGAAAIILVALFMR
jgi:uncharacterized membrane protein (UPF0182 family)